MNVCLYGYVWVRVRFSFSFFKEKSLIYLIDIIGDFQLSYISVDNDRDNKEYSSENIDFIAWDLRHVCQCKKRRLYLYSENCFQVRDRAGWPYYWEPIIHCNCLHSVAMISYTSSAKGTISKGTILSPPERSITKRVLGNSPKGFTTKPARR